MIPKESFVDTREKISLKSTPFFYVKPFAISLALNLSMFTI